MIVLFPGIKHGDIVQDNHGFAVPQVFQGNGIGFQIMVQGFAVVENGIIQDA